LNSPLRATALLLSLLEPELKEYSEDLSFPSRTCIERNAEEPQLFLL